MALMSVWAGLWFGMSVSVYRKETMSIGALQLGLQVCGIQNIHAVRSCWSMLFGYIVIWLHTVHH